MSDVEGCAHWPYSTPLPAPGNAPFPAVPTLILSGTGDLRTPTSGARELAAQIPGAHLLVVPYTGHAVLGDEPTPCAREAMIAMFAGGAVKPCPATPPPPSLRPPALPPMHLGLVSPEHGYHGLPGLTLSAIRLTFADLDRQLLLALGSAEDLSAATAIHIGGLRAGSAQFGSTGLVLHGYSFVPGVSISGTVKLETANLEVGGYSDAHGKLQLGPHRALVGTLGGQHVVLPPNPSATAAIVGEDAQESSYRRAGGVGSGAAARELAGLLSAIQP
ncbi:MAG TPA: alpha/beta hydrolase [Solirubrobacteraceae bacterium]|nr:alpha/beta hydrolase [Solirubrobacteraceae bacterium]